MSGEDKLVCIKCKSDQFCVLHDSTKSTKVECVGCGMLVHFADKLITWRYNNDIIDDVDNYPVVDTTCPVYGGTHYLEDCNKQNRALISP